MNSMAGPEDLRPRGSKMSSINNTNEYNPNTQRQSAPQPEIFDKYFIVAIGVTFFVCMIVYYSGTYSKSPTLQQNLLLQSTFAPTILPVKLPQPIVPQNTQKIVVAKEKVISLDPSLSSPQDPPKQIEKISKEEDNLSKEDENLSKEEEVQEQETQKEVPLKPKPIKTKPQPKSKPQPKQGEQDSELSPKKVAPAPKPSKKKLPVSQGDGEIVTISKDGEDSTSEPIEKNEPVQVVISRSDSNKRCGGPKQAANTRLCANDDKMCGHWENHRFKPTTCQYADITAEQARKCIGSNTIAFVGDNHMREIAYAVASFLLGETVDTVPTDGKADHLHKIENNGTQIPEFSTWPYGNSPNNGFVFPNEKMSKRLGYRWQIQFWAINRKKTFVEQGLDVLQNEMPKAWSVLKPIDIAFWSHGIHDYGWYNTKPYGQHFYDRIYGPWSAISYNFTVPVVWTSFNSLCQAKAKVRTGKGVRPEMYEMVEDINQFMNKKLLERKLPYWDAASALRCPERCDLSDDGMHVKLYVDIMRAKMLFNHLCDDRMNWRGSTNDFV